ncbi:TolC family protein [Chitinophaga solisilvae]|uniref:TolC family protein n=1 Tax=Chitinophaga solisilvae TaxID=1233460 RepID=A0A433WHT4_9BACT|nr:TolC family protein [Chitinophaga solisilvae]NSL85421.1 TolC family protein [Chitinophaga solisilvae]
MNSKSIYARLYALASGIVLALGFQTVSAQSTKPLSLNEAISLSIQNSKQLKASYAKIEEAKANIKTANERQLPDVSISGSYLRLTQPNIDLKLGKKDGGSGGGGESPKVNSAAYGIASVSVPIFSGMMIQSGKEAARYLATAAKLDADKDKEDIIQNTIAAYSNLYKAEEAVKLVKENLKQSGQRVHDFSNLEKNGLLARNDLLKAELQQSNYELALMDAENNLKVSTLNMNIMLGLPDNTVLQLDTTAFKASSGNIDGRGEAEFEQLAYQHRKDAAALSARAGAATAQVKSVKGEYYPALAFTGGYVAAYIPNVVTITNAVNAGVGLKYSVSSLWKTGSKVASAKAQLAEVQANEARLTDAIHLDVYQSYENYLLSHKKMDTYIKAIEQSEENYRITKNKHDNNLATTTDLLDADVANLQSHLNYTYAKADALVAYNKLLQAAGILENNNK